MGTWCRRQSVCGGEGRVCCCESRVARLVEKAVEGQVCGGPSVTIMGESIGGHA